jgi:hypothetical protein
MDDDETNLWIPITSSTRQEHHEHHDDHDADQQDISPEAQRLLDREGRWDEIQYSHEEIDVQRPLRGGRAFSIRVLALLCACSLSIGSH